MTMNKPDPIIRGLDQGKDTRGWDKGRDAGEPDDAAERAERLAALQKLEEEDE